MKKLFLLLLTPLICGCPAPSRVNFKRMDIVTIQPYYEQFKDAEEDVEAGWLKPSGYNSFGDLLTGASNCLTSYSPAFKYVLNSKDEVITKEMFQKLGPNQIIMFEGHGSLANMGGGDPEQHSVMWTGQLYDTSKEKTDPDYIESNLVNAEGNEALTMSFIEQYVTDLTGSIVYLGNCYSARECTFAQSFLKKGAAAVIGNSHTTQTIYNSLIEYTTIKTLIQINPQTGKLYTIYEALSKAKSIYGKTDAEKKPIACGSEPTIFGNPYFSLDANQ